VRAALFVHWSKAPVPVVLDPEVTVPIVEKERLVTEEILLYPDVQVIWG
jgi:hypothetical protein